MWSSVGCLALSAASWALFQSCHVKDCQDLGFDEGEQVRITLLNLATGSGDCNIAPLVPGDWFTLTAGAVVKDPYLCDVRGAKPDVPSFAATILTSCRQMATQFGLECTGLTPSGCAVSMQLAIRPHIDRKATTVQGGVTIIWSGSTCSPGGCVGIYDVRIDRLVP